MRARNEDAIRGGYESSRLLKTGHWLSLIVIMLLHPRSLAPGSTPPKSSVVARSIAIVKLTQCHDWGWWCRQGYIRGESILGILRGRYSIPSE